MSISAAHLREEIIRPTLKHLDLWSQSAENLLMGTAAQESQLGFYLKQFGGGPALGIYQMEPATHDDIWDSFLFYDDSLCSRLSELTAQAMDIDEDHPEGNSPLLKIEAQEMIWNFAYATAMCRMHYYRVKEALPKADDISGMAAYWKRYYNTEKGKGTGEEFVKNYNILVP